MLTFFPPSSIFTSQNEKSSRCLGKTTRHVPSYAVAPPGRGGGAAESACERAHARREKQASAATVHRGWCAYMAGSWSAGRYTVLYHRRACRARPTWERHHAPRGRAGAAPRLGQQQRSPRLV